MRDETGHELTNDEETTSRIQATRRASGSAWILLGCLLFATAGLLLYTLPLYAPGETWMVRSLARLGLTSGTCFVASAVVGVLWWSTKVVLRRIETPESGPSELQSRLDLVREDAGALRETVEDVRVQLTRIEDVLLKWEETRPAAEEHGHQDAVFRLAASLDQLGARLDQRMRGHHGDLLGLLERILDRTAALSGTGSPGGSPARAADERIQTGPDRLERRYDIDLGKVGEADGADLGVLDQIDELGQALPSRTSPRIERPGPEIAFDVPEPVEREDLDEKMRMLRELLADEGLRSALEPSRHGGRPGPQAPRHGSQPA